MYEASVNITNTINSPVRKIVAKAELYNGSALLKTFSYNDAIKSIDIERVGEEGKFFGFGVCQKLNIKLRDTKREIEVSTANSFKIYFGGNEELVNTCARYFVTEVNRDENTNELSITAYDAIDAAAAHTVAELTLSSYTIGEFAAAAAALLGLELEIRGVGTEETCFKTEYLSGANFNGTETIRDALTAIAEVTQTIYYVNCEKLIFKRLDKDGAPALTIDKAKYFSLDSGENRKLTKVCHATELGDNVDANLRGKASGEAVRLDKAAADHEIKVKVASKNIFDLSKSLLGDLTDISVWAGIVYDSDTVKEVFNPKTTYTAQFVAECLANISYASVFEGGIGFILHNPNSKESVPVCRITRNILTLGESIEASGTFTTPANLDGFKLLIYTQRCLLEDGTTPVLNRLKYTNIQIEKGTAKTAYTPYIGDLTKVTLNKSGEELTPIIATYTPKADGTVEGVTAISPTTTLYVGAGAIVNAEYYMINNISGTTQYVRNNPFWDMREDIADLVDNALAVVHGFTINQFDCSWRGNFLLEIGDKIALTTKDDKEVISYVINDAISYNGAFKQHTKWSYTENDEETAENPSTLGDALNLTFAKVDKVNKEISMAISDIEANRENISALQLTANDITAKVSSVETTATEAINGISDSVAELTKTVETKLTDEEVSIKITDALSNGVSKVETSTGFTFNEDGLTVSKSDSEISTTITENGMTVNKNDHAVLTANADGVEAIDLKASTYLIIGTNSRFEDYEGGTRTGCFWIGG
jgi:hypothetical protein